MRKRDANGIKDKHEIEEEWREENDLEEGSRGQQAGGDGVRVGREREKNTLKWKNEREAG